MIITARMVPGSTRLPRVRWSTTVATTTSSLYYSAANTPPARDGVPGVTDRWTDGSAVCYYGAAMIAATEKKAGERGDIGWAMDRRDSKTQGRT